MVMIITQKLWYECKNIYFFHLCLVDNLSHPRLPVCDIQCRSSSAVRADCALALINWFSCEEKEDSLSLWNLWVQTPLLSMPFDPCAATHKIKKDEESRHWFCDVITGCSVLASFSNSGVWISVNILFSSVLMLYMNRVRKGQFKRVLSMLQVGLGALLGYNADKVLPLCVRFD